MPRRIRLVLIAALIATLVIDPASACRFCGRWSGGYSGPYYASYGPYYASYGYGCSSCGYDGGYYGYGGYDCGSSGYDSYDGGCSGCGGGYVVSGDDGCCGQTNDEHPTSAEPPTMMQQAPTMAPKTAPEPPTMNHTPSTVNRPPQMESKPLTPPQTPPAEQNTFAPSTDKPAMPSEEPAQATPENDLFSQPPAPAEAKPATPGEDLFGPSTESSPTPPQSNEDLFSTPPADDSSKAPADNTDLFSSPPPAAETAPVDGAAAPSNEDLFGTPAEETTPPADDNSKAAPAEGDSLFNSSGIILHEPGGLASNELRNWLDNTGKYSCRGRVLRVLDGKVQLQKENNRTTTVSLNRLSKNDLQFITRQTNALRAEETSQTAQLGEVPSGQ